MKKILITNQYVRDYSGSELNTYDVAREFTRLGYEVCVSAPILGEPLKSHFDNDGIRLKRLTEIESEYFDIIWGQHFPTLDQLLLDSNVTARKIIFASLSPFEPLESPPLSIDSVHLLVANSEETKARLLEMGCNDKEIALYPNPVGQEFFLQKISLKSTLKRIAIISNHPPAELTDLVILLREKLIDVDVYGIGNIVQYIDADVLMRYDAIISIGRTVQYALAMGLPIFCYDRFGGPGWITAENVNQAAKYNFSGRCVAQKFDANQLIHKIFDGYEEATSHIGRLRVYAENNFKISNHIDNILKRVEQIHKPIMASATLLFKIACRQRQRYINSQSPNYKVQLFIETTEPYNEENSLTYMVEDLRGVHEFCFDLLDVGSIKSFRFDPMQASCIVELIDMYMIGVDEPNQKQSTMSSFSNSNAIMQNGHHYYFDNSDPQIYFSPISTDIKGEGKLFIKLAYLKQTDEALTEILELKKKECSVQQQEHETTKILLEKYRLHNQNLTEIVTSIKGENDEMAAKQDLMLTTNEQLTIELQSRTDEFNSRLVAVTTIGFVQLFVDGGDGWSEENSIKFPVSRGSHTQNFMFDLTQYDLIESLRLDPFDDICGIAFDDLVMHLSDGSSVSISLDWDGQSVIKMEDCVLFMDMDPQLVLSLPMMKYNTKIKGLSLTMRIQKEPRYTVEHIYKLLNSKQNEEIKYLTEKSAGTESQLLEVRNALKKVRSRYAKYKQMCLQLSKQKELIEKQMLAIERTTT